MLSDYFSLPPHSLEYFLGTLSRAWPSKLYTSECPVGRVLDVARKFTSNFTEPTE